MLRTIFRKWLALVVLLGATFLAHAQPTTYVGTSTANYISTFDFTVCSTLPCQNFTTAMSVSGSFTTSAPLAANLIGFNAAPLLTSYSFSDGLTTYSNTDPQVRIYSFEVDTNGSGAITAVAIVLERWFSGAAAHLLNDRLSIFVIASKSAHHNVYCSVIGLSPAGTADSCNAVSIDASASGATGYTLTWALASTPALAPASIPTLSEWGLMGLSALVALFGISRMRRART